MTPMGRADGKNLDLRVSDAERDAVASDLGRHFQDGRLDQAEFDQRVTAAMAAKTRRDLDEVLTDLPQAQAGAPGAAPWRSTPPGLTRGRPPVGALLLLPLLPAALVIGSTGGWQHGWPFAPFGFLWLIVPILVVRIWVRGRRRRQWR